MHCVIPVSGGTCCGDPRSSSFFHNLAFLTVLCYSLVIQSDVSWLCDFSEVRTGMGSGFPLVWNGIASPTLAFAVEKGETIFRKVWFVLWSVAQFSRFIPEAQPTIIQNKNRKCFEMTECKFRDRWWKSSGVRLGFFS